VTRGLQSLIEVLILAAKRNKVVPISPGDRLGPYELLGLLGAGGMGDAMRIFLDDIPSYRCFPPVHFYLGRVQQALGMQSAREWYRTFLEIKAKAGSGAPLVDEARRSLGVGRADARVSKVGAGSPQR